MSNTCNASLQVKEHKLGLHELSRVTGVLHSNLFQPEQQAEYAAVILYTKGCGKEGPYLCRDDVLSGVRAIRLHREGLVKAFWNTIPPEL